MHGAQQRTAVIFANLGTPDAPTASALRRYLREFLSDPRVVEIPRLVWLPILYGAVLPFRSRKSAEKYASIWYPTGSPLRVHTELQTQALTKLLQERGHDVLMRFAMRYGTPGLASVMEEVKSLGAERILILPAYPQYSGTTTASLMDVAYAIQQTWRNQPELCSLKHYHDHPGYIAALRDSVLAYWEQHRRGDKLVMSFHGVPKRTLELGDPYHCECLKTGRLLAEALGLNQDQYVVTFQSRFGKAEWLQPYTAPTLQQLARQGVGRVDVMCPGFVADCIETLEEIAIEAQHDFLAAGGHAFHYIPCLNESPTWIAVLADLAEQAMSGWPTRADPDASRQGELARQRALQHGAGN